MTEDEIVDAQGHGIALSRDDEKPLRNGINGEQATRNADLKPAIDSVVSQHFKGK